jgi:tetratricopeptide (TPR) repeat protein
MRCALGFVTNAARREQLEQQLSNRDFGFYLCSAALFAREPPTAWSFYQKAVDHERRTGDETNLSVNLRNLTEMLIDLGRLFEAEEAAHEALELARKIEAEESICNLLGWVGRVQTLSGWPGEAMTSFEEANEIEKRTPYEGAELYSVLGIYWADLLVRLGRLARAKELTEANLRICRQYGWKEM